LLWVSLFEQAWKCWKQKKSKKLTRK
jgi:hypothetical protein